MERRRRIWRVGMWGALGLAVVLAGAAVAGIWWDFGVFTINHCFLYWTDGRVVVGVADPAWGNVDEASLWSVERRPDQRSMPTGGLWAPDVYSAFWFDMTARWNLEFSSWVAPLSSLAFCVVALWMSRSNPSDCCAQCGYDLAGLSAGSGAVVVCPECGKGDAKGTA